MVEIAEGNKLSSCTSGTETFRDVVVREGGVKEVTEKGGGKEKKRKESLIEVVFSWSMRDILNKKLYKNKVKKIPETFSSVEHYLESYINPLIEETHADMCSSLMLLSQAPTCEILSVEKEKIYKPPKDFYYKAIFETNGDRKKKRDTYKPQSGDVIALTDVRPTHIDDLNRPPRCYLLAHVVNVDEDDPFFPVILATNPIFAEDGEEKPVFVKGSQKKRKPLFATLLINITTNTRILNALQGGKNHKIVKEVLQADPKVHDECDDCSSQDIHVTGQDLHADLNSFNLNDSQTSALLSAVEATRCNHKSSVKLIWGPPGTGKTKTIATLLWVLLKMKCRTLTCTPTNIAVVEVASRFLKMVKESVQQDCYGLGDVVLFGNGDRMKIDDRKDLLDIFLKNRVKRLAECFVPLTGWHHQLTSMISLLEDPATQYHLYLEDLKKRKEAPQNANKGKSEHIERKKKGKQNKIDRDENGKKKKGKQKKKVGIVETMIIEEEEDVILQNNLTMWGFTRKRFDCIEWNLKHCIRILCTHLPTSFLSIGVASKMSKALNLLKLLKTLLHGATYSNKELESVFITSEDSNEDACASSTSLSLKKIIKKCLKVLHSLRRELSLPRFFTELPISSFCLRHARMIFCTASSSSKLNQSKAIDLLVIDEAAQLKESESAIPLQLPRVQHAILIGDERQLPAMIKSKISEKAGFGRSLFERLGSLGQRKHLLNVQYRMHPSISVFPNTEFYRKQICDAHNVKDQSYKRELLQGSMYGSYSFINVSYGMEEIDDGHSLKNMAEVYVISEIVAKLYQASVRSGQIVSVGVISPYKAQVFALQESIGNRYGAHSNFSVSVRSVDGFQGGEQDVIVISTVRSNGNGSVGFLSNFQRTNVALTRARYCLWILGNGATLQNSGCVWKKIVLDAKSRGCYFNVEEDDSLVKAIKDSIIKLNQIDDFLNTNSILFRNARWKVVFGDEFRKSLSKTRDMETRKELLLLLVKLSSGWRHPQGQRNLSLTDGASSHLLEQYKVNDLLNLLWTVEVIVEGAKFIQVLKFWDILRSPEVPKLAKWLDTIFGSFTVDNMNRCKFKCFEGKLEVPMSWGISPVDAHKRVNHNLQLEQLSTQFGSLGLNEAHRRPRFSMFRGRGRKSLGRPRRSSEIG